MNPKVKICGITNLEDALAAVDAGADALGFMFYESSPRCVPPQTVAEIVRELPPFVAKVGVFVNASAQTIRRTVEACGVDTLQLHGDEPPEFCRQFGIKTIKAFRMLDRNSLQTVTAYDRETWLLDAYVPGKLGGTGERFNWELASAAAKLGRRIILAGGLTPANVGDAVRQVRPYGVDVSSGVESFPGKKNPAKIREFVKAAKTLIP